MCYSYEVLDAICVRVAFVASSSDAKYSWQLVDGCYADGAIGHYVQAKPGDTANFSTLPIEVRETTTMPSTVVQTASPEDDQDVAVQPVKEQSGNPAWFFTFLAHIFTLLTLVAVVLYFIHKDEYQKNDDL